MEARRTSGISNAPPCSWSSSPPLELKNAPAEALQANAGFVSFGIHDETNYFPLKFIYVHYCIIIFYCAVIFPRHIEGRKLDRAVWSLSTFHAYVSYHVKVSYFTFSMHFCSICCISYLCTKIINVMP